MDCFKLKPGIERIFPVDQTEYLLQTQKKAPYCVPKVKGGNHFYAVCPECENPIQIVGLFLDTAEAGRKPYGRHHKGSLPGLAEYNEEDYYDCSYSNPKWKKPDALRSPDSYVSKQILRLIYEQYDRMIYVLTQDMEVRISRPLAKKMLQQLLDNRAWRYRMATMNNIPWILGEVAPSTHLYGQWIRRGSQLKQAIEKRCPAAHFQDTVSAQYVRLQHRPGEYLNVQFFFLGHEKTLDASGQHLQESIDFEVTNGNECIYHKTIQIRTDYFLNLIHLPEAWSHRNGSYWEIAHELIDPALFE
ncbi:MAG: hypothetical protein AAGU32_06590 [Bacillota bacterium]